MRREPLPKWERLLEEESEKERRGEGAMPPSLSFLASKRSSGWGKTTAKYRFYGGSAGMGYKKKYEQLELSATALYREHNRLKWREEE